MTTRVLYIDDDEGLARLVRRAMSRRGYEVETASGAEDGLARLREDRFQIVAVDHYMPGKDGLEALALIGALPEPPPVVYVTGSEESRVAVAALKAGAVDYVVKTVGEDFFDLLASSFEQVTERARLRVAAREAEREMRAANERLEALLKEANHRVSNSLSIVSAFVRLQAGAARSGEAREALRDTQQRIAAVAQVHRRLYSSDEIETVEMAGYLAGLVEEVEAAWSTPRSPRPIRLAADPLRLPTDKAVSLGVVVTELLSNACKYAYPEGVAGEVRVELRGSTAGFTLRVDDDGPGFDPAAPPRGTGTGGKLIRAMTQSLGGEIALEPGPGTRARLTVGR